MAASVTRSAPARRSHMIKRPPPNHRARRPRTSALKPPASNVLPYHLVVARWTRCKNRVGTKLEHKAVHRLLTIIPMHIGLLWRTVANRRQAGVRRRSADA